MKIVTSCNGLEPFKEAFLNSESPARCGDNFFARDPNVRILLNFNGEFDTISGNGMGNISCTLDST